MGWEAVLLSLAPGLTSWLLVTCVYLDNSKPKYVPKRLHMNRYMCKLKALFMDTAKRFLNWIGDLINGLDTTPSRMRPPAGISV